MSVRSSVLAAALLLPAAAAWAQRPPIQEMQSPPLTGAPLPQPRAPQPAPVPGQARPPGPTYLQMPVQPPGQAMLQLPAVQAPVTPSPALQAPGLQPPGSPPPGSQLPGLRAQGSPSASPPPGSLPPGSLPPGSSPAGVPAPGGASPPVATVAAVWPNTWVPATGVKLQALDKVNAQATTLTVKVGQPATFGSLTITAKACVVRPPDQPADAAAYLSVTDSHPDSPGFDGWMLANEPSVSMMQNPIYDLRVAGCA